MVPNTEKKQYKSYHTKNTCEILFLDESAIDISIFFAKSCSAEQRVMVYDLSMDSKLVNCVVGHSDCKSADYRKMCFTNHHAVYMAYKQEYDLVVIYTDDQATLKQYDVQYDALYFSFSVSRYVFNKMDSLLNSEDISEVPYGIICRGTEEQANYFQFKEYLQLATIHKNKPRRLSYIPVSENDINCLIKFEYGFYNERELSLPMRDFIYEVYDLLLGITGRVHKVRKWDERRMLCKWVM